MVRTLAPMICGRSACARSRPSRHSVRKLATGSAWSFSEGPELNGLEKWGKALANMDRRAGIQALVAAAQHGLPRVIATGGEAVADLGFAGKDSDPIVDGAAVEVQVLRAARWLLDPSDANRASLDKAYDRTRQLNVWDDDLLPSATEQFYWYLEVGQCACAAILNDEKPGTEDSYYGWSPSTCIARGLVVAARGLRTPGADFDAALDKMGAAIATAFGVRAHVAA